MTRKATLPFTLRSKQDVLGPASITTTTETVHGLLHLDGERLVIQWRLARKTDLIGHELRTDREVEAVRQVEVAMESISSALVRKSWLDWFRGPRLVLTASDLTAFEGVAGEGGLSLAHPAELVLKIRRVDRLAAEEFTSELVLAVAELAMEAGAEHKSLPRSAGGTAGGESP